MKTKFYLAFVCSLFCIAAQAGNDKPASATADWYTKATNTLRTKNFTPPPITPEWLSSPDGILQDILINPTLQAQTTYGYTVAGLGDINGDGFDDVAIGAPTMADLISGNGHLTSVGAVFIYLGSMNGLSAEPDKVLQPSTALNGALFGYSIDAGDITGDGKNDIVIGAPLDSYTTTASGIFPSSVTVRAGKVYVYRSEDLFSTANPAPFLQLRLQGSTYFSGSILTSNINVNALFGFSVAVTKSLNPTIDSKADIIIGCPGFVGVDLLSVQQGAAFIYYSDNLSTTSPAQLDPPDMSLLGIAGLPILNTKGLLFGYSVDGAGDYDHNGQPDVVVGAPAGIDLSSLFGIFSGQVLGGSAYVFYGNGTVVSTTTTAKLQASSSGLLSNAANLFGYKVKGATDGNGNKTGSIIIGSPTGGVTNNIGSLTVKGGQVHVFTRHTTGAPAAGTFTSTQTLSSPRYSSVLSLLTGKTFTVSLLYGASIDNMLDVNCDNIGDIIVGEPLSTSVKFLGTDLAGGAAYVYLGNADGTYNTVANWNLSDDVSPALGVNTTPLTGFSVAGARHTKGNMHGVRSMVGGPGNALDFGTGLLQLNNTVGTLLDFVIDNNGLGKSATYGFNTCNTVLPVHLLEFKGSAVDQTVPLTWKATTEINFSHYELQRSKDGVHYQSLAIVFGNGEGLYNYAYTDRNPFMGTNFYRLKMIDKDETFTYSDIVIVRFGSELILNAVIAPNPVQQDIRLQVNNFNKGVYKIELMNAAGQVITTKVLTLLQGDQAIILPRIASMSPGIYWLTIYNADNRQIKTLRAVVQ